jgi:hypothetical protein
MFPKDMVKVCVDEPTGDEPVTGLKRPLLRDRHMRKQVLHEIKGPQLSGGFPNDGVRLIIFNRHPVVHAKQVLPPLTAVIVRINNDQVIRRVLGGCSDDRLDVSYC